MLRSDTDVDFSLPHYLKDMQVLPADKVMPHMTYATPVFPLC